MGGLKIKVQYYTKSTLWDQIQWSNNHNGLKIKGCKIVL